MASIFQRAVEAQAPLREDKPSPWTRKLLPLGYCLAFVAASYTIIPLMLMCNLAMYVAWMGMMGMHVVRATVRHVRHRCGGVSMEMADALATDYRDALISGSLPAPNATPLDLAKLRAQARQALSEEDASD